MDVTGDDIRDAARRLRLTGRPACVHASLRSFGPAGADPSAIVAGFQATGCTLLVPSFTDAYLVAPPPDQRPVRNAWDYAADADAGPSLGSGLIYTPESTRIDAEMGALPAAVVASPGRSRGDHPLNSFAAVGPLAARLASAQRPLDVYGPLRELAAAGGWVVLMGVGPTRMTLTHLAEAMAGRRPFRRWANDRGGRPMMVETGGCSEGFNNLGPVLAPHAATTRVGSSRWLAFEAGPTLQALADAIRTRPEVTRCGDPECGRCCDAIAGGPILPPGAC